MNKLLFKLNSKLIFRSFIFYLFVFLIFGGYVFFSFQLLSDSYYSNYVVFFDTLTFMDTVMYVLLFSVAVFFSQQKNTLENICFVPRSKSVGVKFLSVIVCSSTICLIPFAFMMISGIAEKVGTLFVLLSVVYGVSRWLVIILIAQTFGFLIGYITNSVYSYLFAIPLTVLNTFLNKYLFRWLFSGDINKMYSFSHYFSSQQKFADGMPVEYRGPVVDAEFFVKLFISVFVFLTIYFIIIQIARKKVTLKAMSGTLISAAFLCIFSVFYFQLHPVRYMNEEKLYISGYERQPYEITSYSGNISLKELAEYDIAVGIKRTGNSDSVTLRLDESLDIKSLEIGGEIAHFEREGDLLTVRVEDDEFSLRLCCRGRISYVSNANSMNIYTSAVSCALPPDFAFLPKIDGDKSQKQYDLKIKSGNTLISNLDMQKQGDIYIISDSASTACFFSGFLTQTEKDGITFYYASCDKLTDHDEIYRIFREDSKLYFDHEKNEIVEGKWEEKPKVFIIYYMYGTNAFAVPYDDFVMLHFGFTTQIRGPIC